MKFLRHVFVMAALALYILIPRIEAVKADGPTQELINSICIESEDYELCNKIIHKNLKAPATNLKDLTYIIFSIAIEHASDTYIFIGNILRELTDHEERVGFNICLNVYSEETAIFLDVRNEFRHKDYERMILDISSTIEILKNCRVDFGIPPYMENPLIEKNRVMKILINMSTVSGRMVKNGNASLLSSLVSGLDSFFFQYLTN
ncbi:unnamed protein product [Microthlaspi erraticum]|uniref:Pectinesterase inhibitor domain-containing protein n=1 Tax=Microthlaspi erraticum TaxID=1685480 RepID=A0A6D2JDA6_9BRAS|nr:unnamed protein product [Microthlaspi erraticum]